jgi:hypothetical protein
MKTQFNRLAGRSDSSAGVFEAENMKPMNLLLILLELIFTVALFVVLGTTMARAADGTASYTASGYTIRLPYPGDTLAFAADNVQVRNLLSLLRVQSNDERLTGRRTVLMNGLSLPDGSQTIHGTWNGEVGAWNLTDPQNPSFSATAGFWDGTWAGRLQPDGSYQIQVVGRGAGGAIAGLEIVETATRGPGAIGDPDVAVVYRGVVGPAGALNAQVLDNFDDNKVTAWNSFSQDGGMVKLLETNGQFTVNWWTASQLGWHYAASSRYRTWNIEPGKTLEWRVELVSLGQHANASGLEIKQDDGHAYFFIKGHDFLMIFKWLVPDVIVFACERTTLPSTDILLSGAMTRTGSGLILTARLLDKANPNLVRQEISVIDTPLRDASLNTAQVETLTGMHLDCPRDGIGAPYLYGDRYFLAVSQYTADTAWPVVEATFDNLELWTHDIPILTIDRAVRLRWPASAFPFTVEAAPGVNGPWLPVLEPVFESDGMKHLGVPSSDPIKLFRLK